MTPTPKTMLKGKNIIVTGARGDLGRVLVRGFIAEGARVVLTSREETALEEFAKEFDPEQILVVPGDASLPEDVENIFELAEGKFGEVDAVVTSTGRHEPLGLDDSVEDASEMADRHYRSFYKTAQVVSHAAQQIFRTQEKGGLIVHISSHAAVKPHLKGNLTYGPMKAAASHLMKCLMSELEGTKVRVFDIQPATILTESMAKHLDTPEKRAGAIPPERIRDWLIENFDKPSQTKLFDEGFEF